MRTAMKKANFVNFLRDESGATAIEYALIAGMVSICIAAGLTHISTSLQGSLNTVGTAIKTGGQ
jgi:pilus assembly protein Flp/PilA